jgi:hypothetical protein
MSFTAVQPGLSPLELLRRGLSSGLPAMIGAASADPAALGAATLPAPDPSNSVNLSQFPSEAAAPLAPLRVGERGPKMGQLLDGGAKPEKKTLGLNNDEWAMILAGVGDMFNHRAGRQTNSLGGMIQAHQEQAQLEDQRGYDRQKWQAELAAKREEALAPKVEQVGNTLGMFNPATRTFETVFQAPEAFQTYANSLGAAPGTEEYEDAIREFRAGTWNPTGVDGP